MSQMEDHPSPIVKGKRTKRQRPQSPIPFDIATSSPPTPASSAEIFSSTTEEEEDMANCLILLAQGHEYRKPPRQVIDVEDRDYMPNKRNSSYYDPSPKFTSRRYLETATSTGSKAGYYVYQCKTCNRTFPSFQALGGHRASHKKPKNNHNIGSCNNFESLALPSPSTTEKRQMLTLLPSSSDDDGHFRKFSSLSLQLGSNHNVGPSSFYGNSHNAKHGSSSNNKVHECSICGAVFTSGQALGGHMRRHRAAPIGISNPNTTPSSAGAAAITTLSLTPLLAFKEAEDNHPSTPVRLVDQGKVDTNLSLELDLNLPASAQDHQHPEDHRHRDDHQESREPDKFPVMMKPLSPPSQQQIEQKSQSANKSSMVFSSSPALVDCHY